MIVATGGHNGNVNFRRMYDPALTEEYHDLGRALHYQGCRRRARGDGHWGVALDVGEPDQRGRKAVRPPGLESSATRYNGSPAFFPDSPAFFRAGVTGLNVRDWQDAIMVKENGKRFYEETLRGKPLGSPGWREAVRAAMKWSGDPKRLNGGGPIWAIFDAEAAKREEWTLDMPWVDKKGGFFFEADTHRGTGEQGEGVPVPMAGDAGRGAPRDGDPVQLVCRLGCGCRFRQADAHPQDRDAAVLRRVGDTSAA